MKFYFIYALGTGNRCYVDHDGNLCYDPDLMGEVTARSVFEGSVSGSYRDIEFVLCSQDEKTGDIEVVERREGTREIGW